MAYEREEIRSAEERYPDLFAFIDAANDYFSNVIDSGALPIPESHLQVVRICAVIRAYNLLKSIRQLLAADHWENAAILMRSLFELVLNIEEVERNPVKAEEQAERFVRFETLQRYRRLRSGSDYDVRTNRRSTHDPQLIAIEKAIVQFCGEWAEKRKDGTVKWKTSWCGKTVKQLCEASGSSVRIGQYEIVYAFASDMAHSSPCSVLSTWQQQNNIDWKAFFAQNDESERRQALNVMSLSIAFACEIVGITGFVNGAFDPVKMLQVTRKLYELNGAKPPPLHPSVEAMLQQSVNQSIAAAAEGTLDSSSRRDVVMEAASEHRYNRLTWEQMNDAIAAQKVVILPVGSTEQHGPHLPLDVDAFLVESVCLELGRARPIACSCCRPSPSASTGTTSTFPARSTSSPRHSSRSASASPRASRITDSRRS